ncbi:MAG: RNA methyltransferase [Nitrospira sp. SB0662_bin_26]|nr:RNA methyltransferase [Nitrospira sp. SB0662_bin_26]
MTSPSTTRSITSPQNTHVRRWAALQEARGIERFRQCLVSGKKVVQETLAQHPAECLELIHCVKTPLPFSIPAHVKTYALSAPLFEKIDLFGTGAPILVCEAPPFPSANLKTRPQGLEILCPLGDPANVGALIRTAAAMGVERIILLKESAHPYHLKAIRAASGTMFKMSLSQGPSIRDLPEPATWATLDTQGESLSGFHWPKDVRLLVGEEGPGLPPRSSGTRLAVPMADSVESLNAVVAAGMALYAYRVQHPLTNPGLRS